MIRTKFWFSLSIFMVFSVTACNAIIEKIEETNTSKIAKSDESNDLINDTIYKSNNLKIVKLSDHTYQHISYLNTDDFGRVGCNGMIVINENQSIIFDTPTDDESSEELINYVTNNLKSKIMAIIPTHFHNDCVGGIAVFDKHQIQAYTSNLTIQLLKKENNKSADGMKGFDDSLSLPLGDKKVIAKYLGEGHTKDNIVGYFPAENVLFGGCLIKEEGAGKGYLGDANIKEWPSTVSKVKNQFPDVKIVIPGHGESGGINLLNYTEALFK